MWLHHRKRVLWAGQINPNPTEGIYSYLPVHKKETPTISTCPWTTSSQLAQMLQPNLTVLVTGAKEMSNPLLEELKLVFHGAKWEVTLLLLVSLSPPLWKNTFFSLQQKHHIACGPCSLGVSEKNVSFSPLQHTGSVCVLCWWWCWEHGLSFWQIWVRHTVMAFLLYVHSLKDETQHHENPYMGHLRTSFPSDLIIQPTLKLLMEWMRNPCPFHLYLHNLILFIMCTWTPPVHLALKNWGLQT